MSLQPLQRQVLIDGCRVVHDVDVRVLHISDDGSVRTRQSSAPDDPLSRDRPIEDLGPRRNFMYPQIRKTLLEYGEGLSDAVTSDAPVDREQFRREIVHPSAHRGICDGGRFYWHAPYDRRVADGNKSPDILVVTASLGRRPEYLKQSLESIARQSVPADVVLVGPIHEPTLVRAAADFGAHLLPDPGSLAAAINLGVSERGHAYEYVTWLNDDDLLESGALERTRDALRQHEGATVAYGSCRYIDDAGRELWTNRAGRWAPWVLKWGPDLIPQPGSLIRLSAWQEVGGLDESYGLAFDLDLLLRLQKVGPLLDVGHVVSSFRWHADSLTVDDRARNISESERAKRAALSARARRLAWIWEPPVRWATYLAANEVQRRASRLAGASTNR